MEPLNERRKRILQAVISEYVMTAEPVGSRTISKRYEIDLSPATIRNIMSDLEELGYFMQPHTSSGRVPTDKAFRFYIEEIAHFNPLDADTQQSLQSRAEHTERDVRSLVSETSKALSEYSQSVGFGFLPTLAAARFRHIQFISLNRRQVLVVFVSDANLVQNRVVNIDREVRQADLERMSNYLNALVAGLTLKEARARMVEELTSERLQYDALLQKAAELGAAVMGEGEDVIIRGESNMLLAPEFGEVDRIRTLFRAFEEKNLIVQLLDRALASPGVHIYLGNEVEEQTLENCALVTGTYGSGGKLLGAIGVIGPMRMDYTRVVPLVEYTSRLISQQLETFSTDE